MVAQADAREAAEAKRAEVEREARNEEVQAQAVEFYRQQAEARGEDITALDVATGRLSGRSLAEIFADASEAANRADAVAAARASREAGTAPVHVFVGDVQLPQPSARSRGPIGRAMDSRLRHFRDAREARQRTAMAESHLAEGRDDYGILNGVKPPRRRQAEVIGPSHRSDEELRVSFR
jgi:hypothetical protein